MKILNVGRIEQNKNQKLIIEMAKALGKEFQFTIIGELNHTYKLPKLRNVKILKPMNADKLIEQYKKHDLFILPSFWEMQSAVVLEAQASGLPCIVSDNGGLRSSFKDTVLYANPNYAWDWIALIRLLNESKGIYIELSRKLDEYREHPLSDDELGNLLQKMTRL